MNILTVASEYPVTSMTFSCRIPQRFWWDRFEALRDFGEKYDVILMLESKHEEYRDEDGRIYSDGAVYFRFRTTINFPVMDAILNSMGEWVLTDA